MTKVELQGRATRSWIPRSIIRRLLTRLAIQDNVTYGPALRVGRGAIVSAPHALVIGGGVSIGPRTVVQVDGTIGDYALIGMGVQIVGRHDHAIDEVGQPYVLATWSGDRPQTEGDHVRIGRDVWIGANSVVLSGVEIGEGALIGAGSVVTKDVPPYSVCVGNPARIISTRFNEEDIERHRAALDALSDRFRNGA